MNKCAAQCDLKLIDQCQHVLISATQLKTGVSAAEQHTCQHVLISETQLKTGVNAAEQHTCGRYH